MIKISNPLTGPDLPPMKRQKLTKSQEIVSKTALATVQKEGLCCHLFTPRDCLKKWSDFFQKDFSEAFPSLHECRCLQMDELARSILEMKTIEETIKLFPQEKPLTLVSVGCGGCFQELIYMIKLVMAGYTRIEMVLIDSHEDQERIREAVKSLQEFYEKHLLQLPTAPQITFCLFSSIDSYHKQTEKQPSLKADIMLGIDLQGEKANGQNFARECIATFTSQKLLKTRSLVVFTEECTPLTEEGPYHSLHPFCKKQQLFFRSGDIYTRSMHGQSYLYRSAIYSSGAVNVIDCR